MPVMCRRGGEGGREDDERGCESLGRGRERRHAPPPERQCSTIARLCRGRVGTVLCAVCFERWIKEDRCAVCPAMWKSEAPHDHTLTPLAHTHNIQHTQTSPQCQGHKVWHLLLHPSKQASHHHAASSSRTSSSSRTLADNLVLLQHYYQDDISSTAPSTRSHPSFPSHPLFQQERYVWARRSVVAFLAPPSPLPPSCSTSSTLISVVPSLFCAAFDRGRKAQLVMYRNQAER